MSDDPDSLVCWCFSHRVADVQRDVREHGTSTIVMAVMQACRAGQARCAELNPAGTCCLGRLRAVAQAAADDCCDRSPE